jgi:hypothetical protein
MVILQALRMPMSNNSPIARASTPPVRGVNRATAACRQQTAGCRFVDRVAMHELLHDRLGKELIEPRLVQCALSSHCAQGCMAILRTAPRPTLGGHHYSTNA